MQVMTPVGMWEAKEDFQASAPISSLIKFLIEEMQIPTGDRFEMIDGNGKVIDLSIEVGLVCDSYLELVATGSAI